MDTKTNPSTWIAVRAKEPDFVSFMGVATAEEATAAALLRCTNSAGAIVPDAVEKLKSDYLASLRAKWGLPGNAGAL